MFIKSCSVHAWTFWLEINGAAFPGMFAEDLAPDRHNILWRLLAGQAQVATYPPHHFPVWLSLFSLNIAGSLLQKMWQLFPYPS